MKFASVETRELELYQSRIAELDQCAITLPIASPEHNAIAIEHKARLTALGKEVKAEKEKATKPMNEALRRMREWWAPLEDIIAKKSKLIGDALLAYKQSVEAEAARKAKLIAARVERGTMTIETAERRIDALPEVQKTTHTSSGQVQFRKIPQMRIVDENLIPDKYWVIDMVALRRDVIAGEVVPGAEKYFEERV